ncbi:hypothetical protein AB0J83_50525, partial [Actinoplanes sp. NPDC049596]
ARLAGPSGRDNQMQRLRVLATAATAQAIQGLPAELRDRLRQAIDDAATGQDGPHALVGRVLLQPAEHAAQARSALPGLHRSVRDYMAAGPPSRSQLIIGVGLMAQAVHDLPAALRWWDLGVDHFHRAGAIGDEAWMLRERAVIRVGLGRLTEGLADAEMALRLSQDLGLRVTTADSAFAAARAYAWRGDNARARDALRQGEQVLPDATFLRARASWSAGLIALNEHRYSDAWDLLSGTQAIATTGLWSLGDLTEAAVHLGHESAVEPLLTRAAEQAAAFASPYLDNLLLRARAQIAPGPEAEAHYEAALALPAPAAGALESARTRLAYGEWLRRRRRIVD